MDIKTVSVDKLFTLGNYCNERIGLTANVAEGESAELVASQLFLKITNIEDVFATYRNLISHIEMVEEQLHHSETQLTYSERELADMKISIDKLNEIISKGGEVSDERLQHACKSKSYKDVKATVESNRESVESKRQLLADLKTIKTTIQDRITKGNFSLEGLDIPVIKREAFY